MEGETQDPDAERESASAGEERVEVDSSWRLLSLLLGIALAFAATVMVINALDVADTLRCDDPEVARQVAEGGAVECYQGSQLQRTVTVALGMASGGLALVGAVIAAWVAATARPSNLVLPLTGAAIALGVATIVVNNV